MSKKWFLWILGICVCKAVFFLWNGTFLKQSSMVSHLSEPGTNTQDVVERYPNSMRASQVGAYQRKNRSSALPSQSDMSSDKALVAFSKNEDQDAQNEGGIILSGNNNPVPLLRPSVLPVSLAKGKNPRYGTVNLASGPGAVFTEGRRPEISFSLKFLNRGTIDFTAADGSPQVLSSLSYHPERKAFYVLSADSGNKTPQVLELKLADDPYSKDKYYFQTDVQAFSLFKNEQGGVFSSPLEGMTFHSRDEFFVNLKGGHFEDTYAPSSILKFGVGKGFQYAIGLPEMFYPSPKDQVLYEKSGVYKNRGLNALSSQYGSDHLWFASERALAQDRFSIDETSRSSLNGPGRRANPARQFIRLTQIGTQRGEPLSQFIYPMESFIQEGNKAGENTLVDFIVLSDKKLLVMEKADFSSNQGAENDVDKNTPAESVRLYVTDCNNASNVLSYKSLQNGSFRLCGKSKLEDVFKSLDGLPAGRLGHLAKGPEISPNEWILVLMDRNIRSQKAHFLIYQYKEN